MRSDYINLRVRSILLDRRLVGRNAKSDKSTVLTQRIRFIRGTFLAVPGVVETTWEAQAAMPKPAIFLLDRFKAMSKITVPFTNRLLCAF